mgnify:FL=1
MSEPRCNDLTNPFQRARSMSGISQQALAEALKIQQPAISGYENGDFPSPEVAKRFVLWCRKRKIRMSLDEVFEQLTV